MLRGTFRYAIQTATFLGALKQFDIDIITAAIQNDCQLAILSRTSPQNLRVLSISVVHNTARLKTSRNPVYGRKDKRTYAGENIISQKKQTWERSAKLLQSYREFKGENFFERHSSFSAHTKIGNFTYFTYFEENAIFRIWLRPRRKCLLKNRVYRRLRVFTESH